MDIIASLSFKEDGDHLARFCIIAKTARVGHPDELVVDERIGRDEGFGDHFFEFCEVGLIGDDEILAIDEPIGSARIGRACERHRKGMFLNIR